MDTKKCLESKEAYDDYATKREEDIIGHINSKQPVKNEIILKLKTKKKEINESIYFLDNTEGHEYLKELNENNVKIYIDEKEYNYSKYFIPDKKGIYTIRIEFNIQMTNCSYMFYECDNIIEADLSNFDSQNVIDLSFMFTECNKIKSIYLTNFNTKKVTNMASMFKDCSKLKEKDLCHFDMINDVNTDDMFLFCYNLDRIKINKIYSNIFEEIDSKITDKIISVDIEVEKKMDEILSKKAPNSLLDVISDKFSKPVKLIKEEIKMHLNEFELTEVYMKEILKNFSSKTKIIFDLNKDKDSIYFVMSKIYGRSKIGCFISYKYNDKDDDNLICCYLNGKFEILNNVFSFENNDLFTYVATVMDYNCYGFISYKPQNSKFIYKLMNDCVYIILIIHDNMRAMFKIKDNFYKNPIEFLDSHSTFRDKEKFTEKFFEKNMNDIKNIFDENYESSNKKFLNLKELIIYQIED